MLFNPNTGGLPVNFRVVGGLTQPTAPKENTIWVNTNTAISGYTISGIATPGWAMPSGWVYINAEIGKASGSPEFNALKKNEILIKPASVKQYVGGQWVDKEAKIYQGGVWVHFDTGYIYRNGAFEDVTGLTCTRCYTGKTKNNLTITTDGNVYANAYTAEMVDMTYASTVKIVLESGTKGYSASIGVMPTTPVQNASTGNISGYQARKVIKSSGFDSFSGTYMLNVSAVTGKQYVVIEIAGSGSGSGHLIVSEISYL